MKIVYTATALFVLATASAPALNLQTVTLSAKGGAATTSSTPDSTLGPSTSVVPNCPKSDPNGCGILD